jgi:ATP-binding cassette subfamily C protein CydC
VNAALVRRLAVAAVLGAATDLAGIALTATATWLLCRAAQQPPMVALTLAIVAVRAFAVGKGVLRYGERLSSHDAALGRLATIRAAVFNGLVGGARPATDEIDIRPADALSRLVSDVDGEQDRLLRVVLPAITSALLGAAGIGFVAWTAPPAAVAITGGVVLAGLVLPLLVYRLATRAARDGAALRAALLETTVDVIHGAADLAALGLTQRAVVAGGVQADQLATVERRTGYRRTVIEGVGALLPGATAIAVLLLASPAAGDSIMLPVVAMVALAAVELMLPLTSAAVRLAELRPGLRRVAELTQAGGLTDPLPDPVAEPAYPATVTLRLTGVGARYPGADAAALTDVDLELTPGKRVALVGPSGAGKSTLLGVLAGTVAVAAGSLTVDSGEPAVVPRWRLAGGALADGYVFHTTIRENVTVGRPGLDDDAVRDALTQAGLPDWAEELDRIVGEQGDAISGGQRQRLLLARAFVAPTPVLLLDEPTEGLDPEAADALLADLLRTARRHRRSVVLVTHRLAGLPDCDEILVLDGGRVIDRGRHRDLIASGGWYAEQWAAQRLVELAYAGILPGR